jgi:NAD(P)-dependent dehydrogenase (short-subunit alcohol dehydrogenase family)
MNRFQNKTVLVTGGSSGIGLAVAQAYAAEGAQVVITGRDEAALARAATQIGAGTRTLRNDAARVEEAAAMARTLAADGLRLDAVFINAGVAEFGAFADMSEAIWDRSFATNVKGAYFQIQALLPLLNRGAAIVLNGSINAHIGMPGSSIYAASKAALVSLAKTLSAELLGQGVRVNVVSPGPIYTPLHERLGSQMGSVDQHVAQLSSQVPLGRLGTPQELASTILHLSAAESAFIVGAEIVVDGGMIEL